MASASISNWLYDQVMPQLPKKWMSHYLGALAHLQIPAKLNKKVIKAFAKHYEIDLSESEKPIDDYQSLGEFFSRRLKEGARPILGDPIHPCDGALIESGKVHKDLLIQAKGKSYSVNEFLPDNPWPDSFKEGSFFTYYLAPHNYHRVHSPVAGQVKWSTVVPGELWPVNSWSVRNIPELYASNERVITGIETEKGFVIVVMVGATNVGSMTMSYDQNIKTNLRHKKERVHRVYDEGRNLNVGDELGTFNLGSTVVVLYDEKWGFDHKDRVAVKMGERF